MHRPVLVTPPGMLPVSLAKAKLHLHVDHNDDDALIEGLVRAATEHFDGWTGILGRCLVEQEWRQDYDAFAPCLPLPLGPVISITSVNVGGDTIDGGSYALKTDAGGRARVEFDGVSAQSGATSIVYKAGYPTIPEEPADGETPAIPAKSTVPEPIKVAILLHVKLNYDPLDPPARASYQRAIAALTEPYRRVGV